MGGLTDQTRGDLGEAAAAAVEDAVPFGLRGVVGADTPRFFFESTGPTDCLPLKRGLEDMPCLSGEDDAALRLLGVIQRSALAPSVGPALPEAPVRTEFWATASSASRSPIFLLLALKSSSASSLASCFASDFEPFAPVRAIFNWGEGCWTLATC